MTFPTMTIDSEETISRRIVWPLVAGDTGPDLNVSFTGLDLADYDSITMNVRHEDLGVLSRTVTPDATQAYVDDTTTTYPCADQDGLTVVVTIDGGSAQTATFSGATTTLASILSQLNTQLTGATALDNGSGQLRIESDTSGTEGSVSAPTGTSVFTWDTPMAGTGDATLGTVQWQSGDLVEGAHTAEFEFVVGSENFTLPRKYPVELSVRRAVG